MDDRGLSRARAVATLLDSSIPLPGTKRRIGLDPILGLVPFVGDFAGAIFSGYIVLAAARAGVPTFTLIRMLLNIGLDTILGSVPVLGDVFDAAWKSNAMNIALFEKELARYSPEGRTVKGVSRLMGIMLLVSFLFFLALITFVAGLALTALSHTVVGR